MFLGFAIAGVPEVSKARLLTALLAFLVGAMVGARVLAKVCGDALQPALILFGLEMTFLAAAMFAAIGYQSGRPVYRAHFRIPNHCLHCGGHGNQERGRPKARGCRSRDQGFDSDSQWSCRGFFVSRRQQSTMAAAAGLFWPCLQVQLQARSWSDVTSLPRLLSD